MSETGVGRLLVASLHQSIADVLPVRLEFYESWLNPSGLRDGRIGLAPLAAVLSFLRQEGGAYAQVAERAGEYAAGWTVAGLPGVQRTVLRAAPAAIRRRLALLVVRQMVRRTFAGSRAVVRVRRGAITIDIQGSVFCEVRERMPQPLCEFYAASVRRLLRLMALEAEVAALECRATGAGHCSVAVVLPPGGRG
jgi:bacteriochlorophyll 4-vinyl reductase